ncbi:MAG: hypothetical protein J0G96_06330 [Flavobacteriia bacterium]|nr:hypothetical protein [Flavobacteriia bacterium]
MTVNSRLSIIISLSCLLVCCTTKESRAEKISDVSKTDILAELVFVCHSTFATKYHLDRECPGLENCTREIIEIERPKADSLGYSLCGYERP